MKTASDELLRIAESLQSNRTDLRIFMGSQLAHTQTANQLYRAQQDLDACIGLLVGIAQTFRDGTAGRT